jgi:predicted ATPase/DNA-binding winged helix-turn-helix (wHTH) protein
LIRFGPVEIYPESRRLLKGGSPLSVGARAFDLLCALIERRDRVVSKDELLDVVWPDVVVEENNLPVQIGQLRRLLGADIIVTVPGRGYRFAADVQAAPQPGHGEIAAASSVGAAAPPPGNLPERVPVLFGRDAAIDALAKLLCTYRLVSVVGAGGIGKSSLARAVAHALVGRWSDGTWRVDLAGLDDARGVPHAIAQALAISLQGDPPEAALVAELAPRSILLVLDNCEHLLDGVAAVAQAILERAPHVTVLTTSQEPLHLPGEQQYRVTPLDTPATRSDVDARSFPAVALFEARLRAAARHFPITEASLDAIVDICQRLDGLPLAIELAAARAATLGLEPVRDNLDARLRLLGGGDRSAPPRQRTLRAALQWSFSLLDSGEQAVFRRLGVCLGGFTVDLAQALAADETLAPVEVIEHLASLVDKSLVMVEAQHRPRYRLLESARAFALEQLDPKELAAIRARHAAAVAGIFAGADDANRDGDIASATHDALLRPELGNLRAAHAWASGHGGEPEIALTLAACAAGLDDFAAECVAWLLAARPHAERAAAKTASLARYWRAVAASTMNGRIPRALQAEASRRAAELYRELDQPRRVYSALIQLAKHCTARGANDAARDAAAAAHALEDPSWPAMLRVHLLRVDGYLARDAGDLVAALALFREAVRLSVLTQDWVLEVIARANLADLLWQSGPLEEAAAKGLALADELHGARATESDEAVVLSNLMGVLCELGRIDEACVIARRALPLMQRRRTYYLEHWAYLFGCSGQIAASKALLGAAESARSRQAIGERDDLAASPQPVVGVPTPPNYNEVRIVAKLRASLGLGPEDVDPEVVGGRRLREPEWVMLITHALSAIAVS